MATHDTTRRALLGAISLAPVAGLLAAVPVVAARSEAGAAEHADEEILAAWDRYRHSTLAFNATKTETDDEAEQTEREWYAAHTPAQHLLDTAQPQGRAGALALLRYSLQYHTVSRDAIDAVLSEDDAALASLIDSQDRSRDDLEGEALPLARALLALTREA